MEHSQGDLRQCAQMHATARLLVAASGAILISLGLWYGLTALAVGSASLPVAALLGLYALALLVVGMRLVLGRAGRATLGLSIALPAIPVAVVVAVRVLALELGQGSDLNPSLWLVPLGAVLCSFLALLIKRRVPLEG